MQIDIRQIPASGWTPQNVPEFPCCPNPQLDDLAELGQAGDADELIDFLQGSFASTLFAFGQVLREQLPATDLRVAAADLAQLHQGNSELAVHHGNLVIDGDVQPAAALLVTGDLTVNGILRDTGKVAVLGNLHCHSVGSDAWFIVGGDCVARDFVYGDYNDNTFEVLGKIQARAVVTSDHVIYAEEGMQVAHEPSKPGVSWESEVFDLWDADHCEELLAAVGEQIHTLIPLSKFDAMEDA